MKSMPPQAPSSLPPPDLTTDRSQRSLRMAIALSLLLHAAILFAPQIEAPPVELASSAAPGRIETRLAPPMQAAIRPPARTPEVAPATPQAPSKVIAMKNPKGQPTKPSAKKWSVQEKEEMNKFLKELEAEAKTAPSLAERSKAMARNMVRQPGRPDDTGSEIVERIPNSPSIDPFSLEMYLDSLVKKLNKSASFLRTDPKGRGIKPAAVMVRLNPNGSLRSFEILNAADQQHEIDYIKMVVEHAVPFAAFPPDIRKSAQSIGMIICIQPPNSGDGGGGFSRLPSGRRC